MVIVNTEMSEKFTLKKGKYVLAELAYILNNEEYDNLQDSQICENKITKIDLDKAGNSVYAIKTLYGAGKFLAFMDDNFKKIENEIHIDYDYMCLIPDYIILERNSPEIASFLANKYVLFSCHHKDFDISIINNGDFKYDRFTVLTSDKRTRTFKIWKKAQKKKKMQEYHLN